MLNNLTLNTRCSVTTVTGQSIVGVYGGVESIQGDWYILVAADDATHSVSVGAIADAAPSGM